MSAEAFIYDAVRTPRGKGKKTGAMHSVKPISLTTGLIDEVRKRNPGLDPALVDDIVLGVVSPVGEQGSVIARTAALAAGQPETVAGVQLNRFCASGLEAVNLAAQKVRSGFEDLVLAGGVESMSRVPMGSDGGAWPMDPETAAATRFVPQGIGADLIATLGGWSREDVDAYAAESLAGLPSAFAGIGDMGGFDAVALNEYHWVERIDHVHTAGNSSGIVDGAALVVVGTEEAGSRNGLTPRARILSTAVSGADPVIMLTGPAPATHKALAKAGLTVDDIDLVEMNEAFAAVVLRFMADTGFAHEQVNVNGGAISMGHPLGATGAMILGSLVDELERRDLRYGLATLCVGGGMGIATVVERV